MTTVTTTTFHTEMARVQTVHESTSSLITLILSTAEKTMSTELTRGQAHELLKALEAFVRTAPALCERLAGPQRNTTPPLCARNVS